MIREWTSGPPAGVVIADGAQLAWCQHCGTVQVVAGFRCVNSARYRACGQAGAFGLVEIDPCRRCRPLIGSLALHRRRLPADVAIRLCQALRGVYRCPVGWRA